MSSVVNQIEGTTAGTNDMMDVDGQQSTGLNGPPGNHPVRAGNKGEQFVREFCKMNPVKRAIRDDKDEKALRRNIPCHYDTLAEDFVAKHFTNEAMLPTLKPTEVVGIIMAHIRILL